MPPHVHVLSQQGEAIFQINEETVSLRDNKGLKPKDINLALSILEENRELIINEWNNIHGK